MTHSKKSIFILLIFSVVIVNIFMVCFMLYIIQDAYQKDKMTAKTNVENLTFLLEQSIHDRVQEISFAMQMLSLNIEQSLVYKSEDSLKDIKTIIQKQKEWIGSGAEIYLVNKYGKMQAANGETIQYLDPNLVHSLKGNKSPFFITKLVKNPHGAGWVNLFIRSYYKNNDIAGFIVTVLPTSYFQKMISTINVGENGVVIVQDLDMRLIARASQKQDFPNTIGDIVGSPELTELIYSHQNMGTAYIKNNSDGIARFGNFRKLESMPIFVAVAFAEPDYLAGWYKEVIKLTCLILIFLLFTIILSWVLWNQIKANFLANYRSRMLLRNAKDGIHVMNLDGVLLEGSDSFFKMIDKTREQAIGKTPSFWDKGFNLVEIKTLFTKGLRRPGGLSFETYYSNSKQGSYPVEISSVLIDIDEEKFFLCSSRDITERKKAEEDQRIAVVAFNSTVGMMITDAGHRILKCNRAFTEITGYQEKELKGQTPNILRSYVHNQAFYDGVWCEIAKKGSWQGEIVNQRKNGEIYPLHILISSVLNDKNQITHYVTTITDLSERKATEEKLEFLTFYDALTNLPNRNLLFQKLALIHQEVQNDDKFGILLTININNLKHLNDSQGREKGDLLVQKISMRLLGCIEKNQIAARVDNDEFVVLVNPYHVSENIVTEYAISLAKKIISILTQHYVLVDLEYRCSINIGISLFSSQFCKNMSELLKRADIALTEAMNQGPNNYQFFNPNIQQKIEERTSVESNLFKAFDEKQFHIYYQIQVNIEQKIIGVEALLRWINPEKGLISPAHFIPIIEQNGFIVILGKWVLEQACNQLNIWAKSEKTQHLTMAVNVSTKQFEQENFVEDVLSILNKTQAPAHLLKLELTESCLITQIDQVIEKMQLLKQHGISFALDDFGTGYSSLTYLQKIPIDQLKIDQGFVRNIVNNSNDLEIAKMLISLANALGISLIAEGVETVDQKNLLVQHGCSEFQGYLFGKPMSISDLNKIL